MTRIISEEEAKRIGSRPIGKKHAVRIAIENLNIGEVLHVTRIDFDWKKRTPLIFINQISKATGKKIYIEETKNRLGWIIRRPV